jgi:hypothetical protein
VKVFRTAAEFSCFLAATRRAVLDTEIHAGQEPNTRLLSRLQVVVFGDYIGRRDGDFWRELRELQWRSDSVPPNEECAKDFHGAAAMQLGGGAVDAIRLSKATHHPCILLC